MSEVKFQSCDAITSDEYSYQLSYLSPPLPNELRFSVETSAFIYLYIYRSINLIINQSTYLPIYFCIQ